MNNTLSQVIDNHSTAVGKNVVEGTAKHILSLAPSYLDGIIRSSIRSLSPSIQLSYKGCKRISAKDEFKMNYANSANKSVYDLARSDLYMVEFEFEYMGETIKRPMYLPFTDDGNLLYFSNTLYNIIPVLSDTVITPSSNEVFVRLLKDKLTFKNLPRNFIINGIKMPRLVIYTEIVKTSAMRLIDKIGRPIAPVGLYLLGEYGIVEVMKRFYGIKADEFFITTDEISQEDREKFNVYESVKVKPKFIKDEVYICDNQLKIGIKKTKKFDQSLENVICGVLYSFDQLPGFASDLNTVLKSGSLEDEIEFWRTLLGRLIYKGSYSVTRITQDMDEHFDTLQGYLDNLIKEKLDENDIHVNNFFDLLNFILGKYNEWLKTSKEYTSDIKNRYVDILYYILYDIIIGFNKVILSLNKRATKTGGKPLEIKEIAKVLTGDFNAKKIFKLVNSKDPGLAIIVTDNTLDIKYPKITALLEDQFGPLSA